MMDSPDNERARPVDWRLAQWRSRMLVALFVVVHCALAWHLRTPLITWGEDDAQYTVLAREIAAGEYRDRWNIEAPIQARYPPGFPALLAAVNLVTGERLDAHLAMLIVCSAASLLLLYDVIRRRIGDNVAIFVTGLSAINPAMLADGGSIMAEAPFRLLVILALWGASFEHPRRWQLFVAGLGAVLSALTRSAGVAVLFALLAYWTFERRWKAVALLLAGSVPVAAWLLWTIVAPEAEQKAVYIDVLTSPLRSSNRRNVLLWTGERVWRYARQDIPGSLAFFAVKHNIADNLAWLGFLLVLFPAGALALWRRWRFPIFLIGSYGTLLLLFPHAVQRFISPMNGLLLLLVATGALALTQRWGRGVQRAALIAATMPFLVGAIQQVGPSVRVMLACDRSSPQAAARSCFPEDAGGFYRLAAYVRETTSPDALFYTSKEAAFYYHADRRSIRENSTRGVPPDSLGRYLREKGVSYASVTPIGVASRRHNAAIAVACRDFELIQAFEGKAVLLRVRPDGPASLEGETCRALTVWRELGPPEWRMSQ